LVVVAEENVMPERKSYRERLRLRGKLLNHARDLARSGAHPDHKSIIPHLEALEGFSDVRSHFEDRTLRTQLDRLCALSRGQAI
jgi:hypothetical protein